jgi:hypothetical protein
MTISMNEPTPAETMARQEWESAVGAADEVIGYSLVGGKENDQLLDSLVNVPFLIEEITLRNGDIVVKKPGGDYKRDYVSVSALIHPDFSKNFRRSRIVFNDGSTGIYRQLIKYLVGKNHLNVDESLPEDGEANSTRYDLPYVTSESGYLSFPVRLYAPEGLRKSEYDGPAGEAVTWYIS